MGAGTGLNTADFTRVQIATAVAFARLPPSRIFSLLSRDDASILRWFRHTIPDAWRRVVSFLSYRPVAHHNANDEHVLVSGLAEWSQNRHSLQPDEMSLVVDLFRVLHQWYEDVRP